MTDTITESLVYQTQSYRGYYVRAFYLNDGSNDARIELWDSKNRIKSGYCPAYKVWNYSAHANDMIDEILEET
jgi:hypothetical protein